MSGAPQSTQPASWEARMLGLARRQGALPYVVDGFFEVNDAVRRGHPVLLRPELPLPGEAVAQATVETPGLREEPDDGEPTIVVSHFSPRTARFVVRDPSSVLGSIEVSPKRLAAWFAARDCTVGVALG